MQLFIRYLTACVLFLSCQQVFSQDKLFTIFNEEIPCKVTAITAHFVTYRPAWNSDEEMQVSLALLKGILHANGMYDRVRAGRISRAFRNLHLMQDLPGVPGQMTFAVNLAQLYLGNLQVSMEYLVNKGKLGLKLPFLVTGSNREGWVWQTGLDANAYLRSRGRFLFHIGPGLRYGRYLDEEWQIAWFPAPDRYRQHESGALLLMLNAGATFRFSRSFQISAQAGLGNMVYKTFASDNFDENQYRPATKFTGEFQLNLGIRF